MPSVLVTGASRGIGRAAAEHLVAAGWDVYAGVRGEAAPAGTTAVTLDITDAEHLAALDGALPARLDAVVNNAGIVIEGPLEALAIDDLRRQLEVNVVGTVAVTQAVLPRIRASRGRIVMVTSVSGRVATPLIGAYIASKFALEGLADAWRMELASWGIRVIVVEPNSTDTAMWQDALGRGDALLDEMSPAHRELYAGHVAGMRKLIGTIQKRTVPPGDVAKVIETALTAARPRARYPVGRSHACRSRRRRRHRPRSWTAS